MSEELTQNNELNPNLNFDNIHAQNLSVDYVILRQLMTCSFYSSQCFNDQQKTFFVNSIKTLNTLCVFYWIADPVFKEQLERLDVDFENICDESEPGSQRSNNNTSLLDVEVEFARKRFLILMSVITKGNKQFLTEDLME